MPAITGPQTAASTLTPRSMPRAEDLASPDAVDAIDGVPAMPLRGLLECAGELLRGLPPVLWVEATVTAVKPNRTGHTLEIADAGAPAGQGATLRVFLGIATLTHLAEASGGPVDPALLVGTTTTLKVAPVWSTRYQLGARLLALGGEAIRSLARQRLDHLRELLRREGLFDRQRRLPVPPDVTRIAVVSPVGAAGQADIAAELARWAAAGLCTIRVHGAAFEGASAPAALAAALRDAAQAIDGARPDILLLVRGGGARAGLEVLDHETVARAVAACPVPVICGCGHAIDRGLVDELAWRSVDTPSKAVALTGRLLRGPALRAQADMQAIAEHAARSLTAAGAALAEQRATIAHRAACREMVARTAVAAMGADLRVALRTAEGGCDRLAWQQHQEFASITVAVTAALDGMARTGRDVLRGVAMAARHSLERADTGEGAWLAIRHAAGLRLDRAEADLARLRDGVSGSAATTLDRAADGLATAEAVVAASSVEATLARGFALVIDAQGAVVRTATGARAARDVTLQLHNGTVAAVVRS